MSSPIGGMCCRTGRSSNRATSRSPSNWSGAAMAPSATQREAGERPPMSAIVNFPVKPEARPYLDLAPAGRDEPTWLAQQRQRALARFAEQGFPSRRGEAWRYLDLRPLEQAPLPPARPAHSPPTDAARALLSEIGFAPAGARLVLLDGCFSHALSAMDGLPAGVWLGPTAAAIEAKPELVETALEALSHDPAQPFAALNAALFADGFVLEVAPGVAVEQPI